MEGIKSALINPKAMLLQLFVDSKKRQFGPVPHNLLSSVKNASSVNYNQVEKNIDKEYADDKSTGFPWIDEFMLKRNYDGPLTQLDQTSLFVIKSVMAQRQREFIYFGSSERININDWLDEDGYLQYAGVEHAKQSIRSRDEINSEFSSVLASKGIVLTNNDQFSITIDFNNKFTISGHQNENRGMEIEKALNEIEDKDWGHRLMTHIWQSNNNYRCGMPQCLYVEYNKYKTNHQLLKYTGYSINELEVRNDGIFTEDGLNIAELFHKNVAEKHPDWPGYADQHTGIIMRNIREINGVQGIQFVRDISMTIDYRNNSLCDANTLVGLGVDQRQWFDHLLSLRGNADQLIAFMEKKSSGYYNNIPIPGLPQYSTKIDFYT